MCGGYNCSKNALTALNVLFLLVSIVLIATASYAKAAAYITSIQIAGGIIACGLFLFIISILGLVAASKHHQVLLFFYFVILFLLFLIQFSVSIACLALSNDNVYDIIGGMWRDGVDNSVVNASITDAEGHLKCCGWNSSLPIDKDGCVETGACTVEQINSKDGCPYCDNVIVDRVASLLVATGGIGFFFSLMELLGVYLAVRFRNQKDPKANPSQFL